MHRLPEDVLVEGILLSDWICIFSACHNVSNRELIFIAWPDGGAYFEQDNIVIEMFNLIRDVYMAAQERKMKKIAAKNKLRRGR